MHRQNFRDRFSIFLLYRHMHLNTPIHENRRVAYVLPLKSIYHYIIEIGHYRFDKKNLSLRKHTQLSDQSWNDPKFETKYLRCGKILAVNSSRPLAAGNVSAAANDSLQEGQWTSTRRWGGHDVCSCKAEWRENFILSLYLANNADGLVVCSVCDRARKCTPL